MAEKHPVVVSRATSRDRSQNEYASS